ncbi:MAG: hypothetical protein FWG73_07280 [Planctomycetaceae bacterium]|nr:hypothetical protein [Planctomycetaceae bacterium]
MKKTFAPFILLAFVFLLGCSDKLPLGGTVTFSDDGEPVPIGAVYFETPTFSAMGSINPDGTYTVGSMDIADGIPKGTYNVTIRGAEEITLIENPDGTRVERRRALIDSKYQSADTSGLSFTVDGTTRRFDIPVDRATR